MRIFIILLSFIIFSCSSGLTPKGILPPDKMEKIVYDLMQVDEYITTFVVKDSVADIKKKRSVFYEQVFNLHNTNRKEFYSSYKYYQQHPNVEKVLFDSLLAKANRSKYEKSIGAPVRMPGQAKPVLP